MNPHTKHSEQWFRFEFDARGGRGVCEWTKEEQSILFGDCNPDRQLEAAELRAKELLRRLEEGLPLSNADRKEARRYKRMGA